MSLPHVIERLAELALSLRPAAGPADRDAFYALRRAAFLAQYERARGPWRDEVLRPMADQEFDDMPVELIERDGTPIGYLALVHHPDHLFLEEIGVVPSLQCRGIGTAVIRLAMQRARAAALPLRLSVFDTNPAQHLYLRLGFAITRVEPPRLKMTWTP